MAEATDNVAWPLLKNRVLTLDANTWPSRAGCLRAGRPKDDLLRLRHRQETVTVASTVLGTAPVALATSCSARSGGSVRVVSEACLRRPRWTARDGQLPVNRDRLYSVTFLRVNGQGESRLDNGCDPCEKVGDDLPSKNGARRTTLVRRVYHTLRLLRTASTVLSISA
jgi:hypothetical protein